MDMEGLKPTEFGDYFAIIQNGDGIEERVKICSIQYIDHLIKTEHLTMALEVGSHYDKTINYSCDECEMTDILCNGESVLSAGRVSIIPVSKMISFNFPRFEDSNSCVYMGFFKTKTKILKKIIATIDNKSVTIPNVVVIPPPKDGEQLDQEVTFTCDDCTVEEVYVNGLKLDNQMRRDSSGPVAFFQATSSAITIRISEYNQAFEGTYQAIFTLGSENVTKTIMEVQDPSERTAAATTPGANGGTGAPGETTAVPNGAATEAGGGDAAAGSEAAPDAPTEAAEAKVK